MLPLTKPEESPVHPRATGFTQIELLIALAIVGLLGAIALPTYTNHLASGRIAEATTGLLLKAVKLEQFFQDHKTYVGAADCSLDTLTSRHFYFQCANSSSEAYALEAFGVNSMGGFRYSINQRSAKQTLSAPSGWDTNKTCWVTGKGALC